VQDHLIKSGIITVIVQDQGSIHTSKIVKERHNYWESKGLYLFNLQTFRHESIAPTGVGMSGCGFSRSHNFKKMNLKFGMI